MSDSQPAHGKCPKCKSKIPTHWMDDSGNVVTEEFLAGPRGTSDWRLAYHIPCRKVRGKIIVIAEDTK